MGVFNNIEIALNTRLATLGSLPPVAWPNTHYIPVENTLFIRPTLLPAETQLDTFSGTEFHKGIYQIDVFAPLEKGIDTLNTWLDSISTVFKANKTLTATDTIYILAVSRGSAERQEAWYTSFVEVKYICYS